MRCWVFRPLDTWFFRGTTPFNREETGHLVVESQFPPFMTTLQGAIRTALAERQGWSRQKPNQSWPPELGGPEDINKLRFFGPYLYLGDIPVFPVPLILFGVWNNKQRWHLTKLVPGEPVNCDIDEGVCLPDLEEPVEEGELLEEYTTAEGLARVLGGGDLRPEDLVRRSSLWAVEPRIGISIDSLTRTARDRHLYRVVHIRPNEDLSLRVWVDGVPDSWHPTEPFPTTLGGEGRLAEVRVVDKPGSPEGILPKVPSLYTTEDHVYFMVTLVTPGRYGCDTSAPEEIVEKTKAVLRWGPEEVKEIHGAKCISACIGKLLSLGGWDMVNKRPRTSVPLIPAGSTWFYSAPVSSMDAVLSLHGKTTGPYASYGFGQMVVGTWKPGGGV